MFGTRLRPNVAAVCLGLLGGECLSAYEGPYTAEILQAKLQEVVRTLNDCHLVVATRHEQRLAKPRTADAWNGVTFYELWLSGDDAQITAQNGTRTVDPWWTEKQIPPRQSPLTAAELLRTDGLMACVRGSGDHVWAEFRKFRPTQRAPTPGVYSRSRSPKRTSTPVVPLIGLHRNWQLPEDRGLWPVVNLLAERPLEFWRVVRTDVRAKKELLYVEVASKNAASTFPLKRRQVTLAVLPIWKVWFSTQEGLAPVRIEESVRYAVDGREYPLEMAVTPLLLYEASDHFQIRPGVWFPRSGKQEQFLRSPDAPPVPFDPDRMVDEMLATHKLVVNEPYVMTDRREWRVLDLKLIPPRNDLWFDAPNGVAVHTLDTNEYFVQGKTEEESRRILGVLEKAPVPSEGRPATVRGVWTIAFIVLNAIAICAFLLRRMALRRHSS